MVGMIYVPLSVDVSGILSELRLSVIAIIAWSSRKAFILHLYAN